MAKPDRQREPSHAEQAVRTDYFTLSWVHPQTGCYFDSQQQTTIMAEHIFANGTKRMENNYAPICLVDNVIYKLVEVS